MYCFEVLLNGKRLCTAGVGDSGVLSTILSWIDELPQSRPKAVRPGIWRANLHVGGLYNPEPHTNVHPRWVARRLKLGDEVTVRLVRASKPDAPSHSVVQTDDEIREQQHRYYLQMKAQFEPDTDSAYSAFKARKRKGAGPKRR